MAVGSKPETVVVVCWLWVLDLKLGKLFGGQIFSDLFVCLDLSRFYEFLINPTYFFGSIVFFENYYCH